MWLKLLSTVSIKRAFVVYLYTDSVHHCFPTRAKQELGKIIRITYKKLLVKTFIR